MNHLLKMFEKKDNIYVMKNDLLWFAQPDRMPEAEFFADLYKKYQICG